MKKKNSSFLYDVIIIGAGPAGVTAGIYSARQKLKTLLLTKDFGGQMARKAVSIENYPGFKEISGFDLIERFKQHLKNYQVKIKKEEVGGIEKKGNVFCVITEKGRKYYSKTVIVCSGADPRPLEVPGEKEFLGKGVSYCSACDGPLFKEKDVAVIGGGNAGFEAALALTSFAKKIYILEFAEKVKAEEILQQRVRKTKKVKIITNAQLKEIKGNKFVEEIVYIDRVLNKEKVLKVQGVFVEIGNNPATGFLKKLVDFSERDEIVIDPVTNMTKTPGLFAAGDVSNVKWKQIIVACGEGAKAALSAYHYLQKLKN